MSSATRRGIALVRRPSRRLADGIVTHIERTPVNVDLATGSTMGTYRRCACDGPCTRYRSADDCPDPVFIEDTVGRLCGCGCRDPAGAPQRRPETEAVERTVARLGLDVADRGARHAGRWRCAAGWLDGLRRAGWSDQRGRNRRSWRASSPAWRRTVVAVAYVACCTEVRHDCAARCAVCHLGELVDLAPFGSVRSVPEEAGAHVVPLGADRILMAASAPRTARPVGGDRSFPDPRGHIRVRATRKAALPASACSFPPHRCSHDPGSRGPTAVTGRRSGRCLSWHPVRQPRSRARRLACHAFPHSVLATRHSPSRRPWPGDPSARRDFGDGDHAMSAHGGHGPAAPSPERQSGRAEWPNDHFDRNDADDRHRSDWDEDGVPGRSEPRSHRHGHSHDAGSIAASARTKRVVTAILVPAMVITVVAPHLLWPGGVSTPAPPADGEQRGYGEVVAVHQQDCPPGPGPAGAREPRSVAMPTCASLRDRARTRR